jgi:hypothetical protein
VLADGEGREDLGELALVAYGGALSAGIALPRDADASSPDATVSQQ